MTASSILKPKQMYGRILPGVLSLLLINSAARGMFASCGVDRPEIGVEGAVYVGVGR